MAPSALQPPTRLSPAAALALSQQAPAILRSSTSIAYPPPLNKLLSGSENSEKWLQYENLIMSCLRTGDDQAAHACLRRLIVRFGDDNERVQALRGLVKEAEARNNGALEEVLKEYNQILSGNDTNIPIAKRRIALLRSMGRLSDATSALVQLLDFSPTDAEAWSELSDIYVSQGMYSQAIYAMEEVLVLAPNAWNIHARLGELQYMAATAPGVASGSYQQYMAEAIKRFSRSIELCDDYLRGYYGLKLVTKRLLIEGALAAKQTEGSEFTLPDTNTIERLNELATAKLSEIVRRSLSHDRGWRGYSEGDIAVARDLLGEDESQVTR
ncbi:protein prenylyltransferase [Parathielavia appendiculata]|uniref:ER membrane protein complex subunit 2 n=1 Tax=Parathielavia appendiculata TaxID=2587402 RepID=A0AAN6TX72_9PEZI|nr:protein prenylyltransferase [Parathielavia appendiculata]